MISCLISSVNREASGDSSRVSLPSHRIYLLYHSGEIFNHFETHLSALFSTMYTFLFLTLLFSPIFNAERIPSDMDNKENLLMRRSVAASYLRKKFCRN